MEKDIDMWPSKSREQVFEWGKRGYYNSELFIFYFFLGFKNLDENQATFILTFLK
jgi:hypothetical protein